MQQDLYEFTKLIRCWQSMPRAEARAPKKTTFSPGSLSSLTPFLFLIERQQNGELAVRLLGSELEKPLDIIPEKPLPESLISESKTSDSMPSARGMAFDTASLFGATMNRDWPFYANFMKTCTNHICAGRLRRTVKRRDGLIQDIESLQVPLADKHGEARFMLGVMIARPAEGRQSQKQLHKKQGVKTSQISPKEAILKCQYIDLGCGLPQAGGVGGPACLSIKSNLKTNELQAGSAGWLVPEPDFVPCPEEPPSRYVT